jgi:pyruvate formate lyase activating enzyme
MKIGSLIKTSLLDYPGKVSAIVGLQGCNMRCPWCHNFFLIPYEFTRHSEIVSQEAFYRFLDQRKTFLDGIVISGGEPTIQSDLPELCTRVKEMGFAVKIDTNGTRPDVLDSLIKHDLVDYIAMDIKTDPDRYNQLFREDIDVNEILKSIDLVMSSDKPYEFRTTCVSPFVNIDNMDQIGMLIKGAESFFLQTCNPTTSMDQDSNYRIANGNRLAKLKQKADAYVLHCEIR